MTRPDLAELERELGAPIPGLAALPPADAARLLLQLRQAREQQERALKQALEQALSHLPVLLRAPVRKLFDRGR